MDRTEARAILQAHLAAYARRDHGELVKWVEARHVEAFDVRGVGGTCYQIEVEFVWDDVPGGVVRILAAIDDGGLAAFCPLALSDLVAPPEAREG